MALEEHEKLLSCVRVLCLLFGVGFVGGVVLGWGWVLQWGLGLLMSVFLSAAL